jgi:hypothetical protein
VFAAEVVLNVPLELETFFLNVSCGSCERKIDGFRLDLEGLVQVQELAAIGIENNTL